MKRIATGTLVFLATFGLFCLFTTGCKAVTPPPHTKLAVALMDDPSSSTGDRMVVWDTNVALVTAKADVYPCEGYDIVLLSWDGKAKSGSTWTFKQVQPVSSRTFKFSFARPLGVLEPAASQLC